MRRLIIAILCILLLPLAVQASVTFSDDFESYSDATNLDGLNGGSNWSGSWSESAAGKYKTNSATVQGGSRSVKYTAEASEPTASRSFSATSAGTFSIYMRKTTTSADFCQINILEGTTFKGAVYLLNDGNIYILDGGSTSLIQAYSANTWYQITIDFDTSTDQYRAKVDAGSYTAFKAMNTVATNIDAIQLQKQAAGNTADCYWDTVATSAAPAFAPLLPEIITL